MNMHFGTFYAEAAIATEIIAVVDGNFKKWFSRNLRLVLH